MLTELLEETTRRPCRDRENEQELRERIAEAIAFDRPMSATIIGDDTDLHVSLMTVWLGPWESKTVFPKTGPSFEEVWSTSGDRWRLRVAFKNE